MKTFLQELADTIKMQYASWERLTVIFPNRRAALYFKRELATDLSSPRWAPSIITIEELIGSFSDLREADKLTLILTLYQSFKKVTNSTETIDRFYYWGEMLLRDFDELDKYLVNAELLFRDVSNLKEVEQHFEYLTEEQQSFLKGFWESVEFSTPETKSKFLELWTSLYPIYKKFQETLLKKNSAYAGMIHRSVALGLSRQKPNPDQHFVFAGFNALTTAEEKIISWFVENQKASVFWDEDEFYVNAEHREAGSFFRLYRKHPILSKTFSKTPASNLSRERAMRVMGVPQKAGQPKLLAQHLLEEKEPANNESRVIVLPDESLLMPLLYSLPTSLDAINVTMGYPLQHTPYFSLLDFLFDLHKNSRKNEFYFRHVLPILNHPYLIATAGKEVSKIKDHITKNNQVYLEENYFKENSIYVFSIFKVVSSSDFIKYLLEIITLMATAPSNGMLEKEFAFHFHRVLTRLQELIQDEPMELLMLQRLFRQIVRSEKIPFSGEPLKGMQIMGVLETRNLDFDHVHVLSLNEGLWPAAAKQGSYLPHSIRKAYGLPTYQQQDAMYAYLFYRLLQRAKHVDLYYNTEPDVLGAGEMSRYLYQIMYEAKWPHERKILYNPVSIRQPQPITILKDVNVLQELQRYVTKELTPSSLNNYLDCKLKFYFKNLIGLKEEDEVEEDADARIFGNIFHDVMQFFYTDLKPPLGVWQIDKEHFGDLPKKLDALVERAYAKHFHLPEHKKITYTGQQLVVNEMVKKMALQVLESDGDYAPFNIEMLEQENFKAVFPISANLIISLGGKIDRVDKKDDVIRIIDYKTGRDENSFTSVAALFDRDDDKRNKAVFQAMLYAWVYARNNSESNQKLQPGLINRKEIFKNEFQYGLSMNKALLYDVSHLLPEFEEHLLGLLNELFDANQSFDQTENVKRCSYCSYKEICSR
jgi:CRISPR/Cas system-associated exonuclease Cas4 (RecB family)